ncbi:hypothetical protein BLOT_009283, partial [Blomia tropicalis]
VSALSSIRINAPDYIFYGDPMWLNCSADLDYNQIYSIKWFKDNQEMYRFITSDESPTTFYPTRGIVIDPIHMVGSIPKNDYTNNAMLGKCGNVTFGIFLEHAYCLTY